MSWAHLAREKKVTLAAVCGLCAATVFVYATCLKAGFVFWDDPRYLLDNMSVRFLNPAGLRRIFTATVSRTYIPLSVLSYALEFRFFGLAPFVYHLDNLLLHVANVVLVFFLVRRFGLSVAGAFWAGLLFAVHPMHVEAVAWVTSRKDVLYTFFFLIAMLAYHSYVVDKKRMYYGVSVAAGLLSVLAKPMALSLPLVLWLCDWFWKRRWSVRLLREKIPYFLTLVPVAWVTYQYHARIPGTRLNESLMTWLWCLTFYLKKFLWPYPCLPLYRMPASFNDPQFDTAFVMFLALAGLLFYFRRARLWTFAFFFYFLSVFYLLRFDTARDLQVVSDRYMYLASFGFCMLGGHLADRFLRRLRPKGAAVQWLGTVAVGMAALILGVVAYRQCRLWGDEPSLWARVIKYSPSSDAYQKMGDYYFLNDRNREALPWYIESARLDPANYESLVNIAVIQATAGQNEAALATMGRVMELTKNYFPAYMNRGVIYGSMGRNDLALRDLTTAVQMDPSSSRALMNRGIVYSAMGRQDPAVADFNEALRINPFAVQAYYNRALAFFRMGNVPAAVSDFEQTLRLEPGHPQARHNLDVIRARQGMLNGGR